MFKLIKDIVAVKKAYADARRAAALLVKQEWSVDFLIVLFKKAVRLHGEGYKLVLENRFGQKISIGVKDEKSSGVEYPDLYNMPESVLIDKMLEAVG